MSFALRRNSTASMRPRDSLETFYPKQPLPDDSPRSSLLADLGNVVDLEDPSHTAKILAEALHGPLIKRQSTLVKAKDLDYGVFCDVCYLERREAEFFDLGCGHKYCKDCTRDHLKENIAQGKAIDIPCISGKECGRKFTIKQVKQFCSLEETNKFETI